ncbi:FAD binding domain-containing protein [Apodospora peruviana]|uniref:FAD binding domain-containing protein n=1 Tax=Apodospora peruviana TaxID=516989 RepID=A0AAE0HV78_9PEZI|nr:FAD binding domain-containing protein [Apodospora peruviana]
MSADAEQVDVLICGSGSAGLCAAVWLSRFGVNYKILERRDGPLQVGQADGVQTRTVEIFDSFGLAEELLRESYHVLELAFWSPPPQDEGVEVGSPGTKGIRRARYAPDKETEISHQPHVILNQARLNELMIGDLEKSSGKVPPIEYGVDVKGVQVDNLKGREYPVKVEAVTQSGVAKTYKARYVLGCDGAHSIIRKSLGFKMVGDTSDAVWGVMDVYVRTNFPDIRKKAVINAAAGNLLIIPREGDEKVRFYIELPSGTGTKASEVTLEGLQERARLIFQPYEFEFVETAWWSAYAIGQRLADHFHQDYRVFLTGDACHTHSPKAGQGMNVSLQDGHNIGWKLGLILNGLAQPAPLLESYIVEREKTARELIEFDRMFTKYFNSKYRQDNGITPQQFADNFVKAGRYTAGQAIQYTDSAVIKTNGERDREIAAKITVGMRFPSAQVVRFCDAKPMQLVKGLPATGAWFLVVFAGDILDSQGATRLEKVSEVLAQTVPRFTPPASDPDSIIDRVLVLASDRKKVEQDQIPSFFTPVTGQWKLKCLCKTYADDESYNDGHGHAYHEYGIDAQKGAVVIVRPDHYVAKVTSLEEVIEKPASIQEFFEGFLIPQV